MNARQKTGSTFTPRMRNEPKARLDAGLHNIQQTTTTRYISQF